MSELKRGVLCLTFDNMGSAIAVGQGQVASRGGDDEGPAGYPETLEMLDRLGLRATFFLEGWNALHNPRAVREIAERGHEIGVHGWTHEVFHSLSSVEAERVLADSLAAFRALDIEPTGFRAPGGKRGVRTLPILKKLGFAYDSSIDHLANAISGDAPHPAPMLLNGDFPNIPWQWPLIDYYQYYMHPAGQQAPETVAALFAEHIDRAAETGTLCTLILHAFVSFQDDARRDAVEQVLERAKADTRIEILTAGAVADRLVKPNG